MRILFLFLVLFLYADAFAIIAESKPTILTMHDNSANFIPEAPQIPKVNPEEFESYDLSASINSADKIINKDLVKYKVSASKKGLPNSDGDLTLPDAWFLSIGFKSEDDPNLISHFEKLKQLKIPVFELYCKHEKNPVQLHIGPSFDKDHKKVRNSILKKTDDSVFKTWLDNHMVVDSFEPTLCEFIS
jgi:hypothetical protein